MSIARTIASANKQSERETEKNRFEPKTDTYSTNKKTHRREQRKKIQNGRHLYFRIRTAVASYCFVVQILVFYSRKLCYCQSVFNEK